MIQTERNTLDCTKFRRDYDILRSLPFPVEVSPVITDNKTFALMDLNSHVTDLTIYKEKFVPLNIYCLKNLNSLTINNTRFYEFGLDDESLRGIPAEIGLLSSLHTLHIYDSPVQHLPKEFGNLDLLTNVIIENGFLQALPTVIENLSLLRSLKLSKNKLKSLPSTFGKLANLQYLWLDHNEITSLPSTMSSLTSLITLDVQSNKLTSIDELNGMTRLNNLYAQNCNIRYLPVNIPKLLNLNMSYNNLEDLFDIGTLGIASSWKDFDFSYNQIDLIPPEIYTIVSSFQTFSVKHNQLTHLPKEIYYLQNYHDIRFDISENLFTDDELNSVKAIIRTTLPDIQFIY